MNNNHRTLLFSLSASGTCQMSPIMFRGWVLVSMFNKVEDKTYSFKLKYNTFIIYKVVKYRKILLIYNVFSLIYC